MKRAVVVIFGGVGGLVVLLLTWPFWLFLFVDGSKLPMPYPGQPQGDMLVVEAKEIMTAFAEDEEAAREKYCKGRVWLKGKVTNISGPTVTLDEDPGVVCIYMSSYEQAILRIGRETMIEGHLKGSKDSITLCRP